MKLLTLHLQNRMEETGKASTEKEEKAMPNNKTFQLVLTSLFAAIIIIMAFTPLGYIPLVVINATIIHIPVILGSLFCGPKKGAVLGFVFGLTSFIKNTITPTLSAFVFSPVLAASKIGVAGFFYSTFICFVPRILVGVVPYFIYLMVKKVLSAQKKLVWATVLNLLVGAFLFVGLRAFVIKMFGQETMAMVVGSVCSVIAAILLEWIAIKKDGKIVAFLYAAVTGSLTNTFLVMGGIYVLYKEPYAAAQNPPVAPEELLGIIGGIISFNGVGEAIVAAVLVAGIGIVLNRIHPIYSNKE